MSGAPDLNRWVQKDEDRLSFHLETVRCRLRAPSEADIPHVFSATRYAGFNDGMLWEAPAAEEELRAPLQKNLEAWRSSTAYSFTIENKEDATFVGRIGIRTTVEARIWNIGFWLHPAQVGKGYMTEAAQAVVDFGFDRLDAEAVEACYATWNIRSKNVLERLGMTQVEFIEKGFQKRGAWVPEYRMRIDRGARKRPNQTAQATPGLRPSVSDL